MRVINILGSTGSIGTQALQIAALHPDKFKVNALTAHRSVDALFAQVRAFRPSMAGLTGMTADEVEIPQELHFCDWHFGQDALLTAARDVPCDDVLVSESDEVVSAGSGINVDITFAFESIELDPNKGYDVYFKSRNPAERRIKSATITVTPIVYTSGIVILNEIMLQSGHSRTAFYVYSSGSAPDVMVKLGDGSYESVAENISKQAVSQTGTACTARRYECEFLPGTYESITIKIEMNAADIVVFGCFGAIL